MADRRSLDEKYCSCVFQVTGRQRAYNPYAVCTSSIYNRRGIGGPGSSISCDYSIEYLQSRPVGQLFNYAVAKGLIDPRDQYSREDLIEIILDFQDRERGYQRE